MEWIFLKRHSALYFSPHSRETYPRCVAFFCAENCREFMGSDPIGHSTSLFRGHDGVRPPVVPGGQDVQLLQ